MDQQKQQSSQNVTYFNEIRSMMFAFGDNHKPNVETTKFVESLVLKQLRTIIQEAFKYWNGQTLRGEELIFLMRKNKLKMQRFVKYLNFKELKSKTDNFVLDGKPNSKPKNELLEFVERIDETGELSDLNEFDQVKYERQLRADRISKALDEKKYLEFHKATCTSFSSKGVLGCSNYEKLKQWLDPKNEINFSPSATEVLFYYAYETVAQIIDYALLVRMDSRRTKDPLSNLSEGHYTAAMFNGDHKFGGTNPDFSKVYNGQGQPPISVAEIREVIRRYNSPQVGMLNFGGKLPDTRYLFAL